LVPGSDPAAAVGARALNYLWLEKQTDSGVCGSRPPGACRARRAAWLVKHFSPQNRRLNRGYTTERFRII